MSVCSGFLLFVWSWGFWLVLFFSLLSVFIVSFLRAFRARSILPPPFSPVWLSFARVSSGLGSLRLSLFGAATFSLLRSFSLSLFNCLPSCVLPLFIFIFVGGVCHSLLARRTRRASLATFEPWESSTRWCLRIKGPPQRKLDGIVTWYFDHVLESLPLMLQGALLLLGCALSRYLWDIDTTVASVVLGATSFGILLYVFIAVVGASSDSCPYQTPGANVIHHVIITSLACPVRPTLCLSNIQRSILCLPNIGVT